MYFVIKPCTSTLYLSATSTGATNCTRITARPHVQNYVTLVPPFMYRYFANFHLSMCYSAVQYLQYGVKGTEHVQVHNYAFEVDLHTGIYTGIMYRYAVLVGPSEVCVWADCWYEECGVLPVLLQFFLVLLPGIRPSTGIAAMMISFPHSPRYAYNYKYGTRTCTVPVRRSIVVLV